mgnify:CR=1 FL=1
MESPDVETRAVLFDLGGVLMDWDPRHLYRKLFGGDEAAMEEFLAAADILINVLPLTPETEGLLNARTFGRMPEGAALIQIGRGGHLVERDLLAALDSGHISGASLDVFETEPLPKDSPLWSHPQVVITPHVASTPMHSAVVANVQRGLASLGL